MPRRLGSSAPRAAATVIALLVVSMGCGSAARESPPPAQAVANEPSTELAAPAGAPRLIVGAVSWELFQSLRIDESGGLFQDDQRTGRLAEDGTFTDAQGTVSARIDADGWIVIGDERTQLRLVGDTLVEVRAEGGQSELVLHVERDALVVGAGQEAERVALVGFRPALAREVLFVSGVMLVGIAHAFGHA